MRLISKTLEAVFWVVVVVVVFVVWLIALLFRESE